MTKEALGNVTKADALKHPNWSMGRKITIDSATMMNKGLEFIEAMHLFGVRPDMIKVLVHPQSIVHSMVEYTDNSVIAQMGPPDMRIPIQYALTWPERAPGISKELDFISAGTLTFEEPDTETFGCLRLGMECAARNDAACPVMNGANEAAVDLFLNDRIGFTEIYEMVADAVDRLGTMRADDIGDVLEADAAARDLVYGKA